MSAALSVEHLSVGLPGAGRRGPAIIKDVSLSLHPGEIIGVVGESGSGKSTLARAIMGLARGRGTLRLDGAALPDSPRGRRALRRSVAFLFQDAASALNPRRRVGASVAEPIRIAGRRPTPAGTAQLLARAGLAPGLWRRFPHELSGGQARRAGVARALAAVPRLLVADEPTAGLDILVQAGLLNLFLDLRDEGIGMLLITHDLAVVRHIADRVLVMYLGRLVETGPTADVFRAPLHPYTRTLLDAARRTGRDAPPPLGQIPSFLARPPGCEFHPRCARARPRCAAGAPSETMFGARTVRCHDPLPAGAIA